LHLNVAFGGAAVIINNADQVRASSGRAPREGPLTHGRLSDEGVAIEPEDLADIGSYAGF
jgi:hypothetical protein